MYKVEQYYRSDQAIGDIVKYLADPSVTLEKNRRDMNTSIC